MKYFLIAGNTRVGSTWVQSSLNSFPGVFSLREIRWKMPYAEPIYPVHNYIEDDTVSISELLESGFISKLEQHQDINVIGAKLKFDPYGFVPPKYFEKLKTIIEENVFVTLIRRPYVEIFQTWKLYGIRHLANLETEKLHIENTKALKSSGELDNLCLFYEHHKIPLRSNEITLETKTNLKDLFKNTKDKTIYPLEDAIHDLFVLFYNDIMFLDVMKNAQQFNWINYASIEKDFHGIAKNLLPGLKPEKSLQSIQEAPTSKIETCSDDLEKMTNNALCEISNYLFSLASDIGNGKQQLKSILNFDEISNTILFKGQKIFEICQKYKELQHLCIEDTTRQNRFLMKDGERHWKVERSVYHPEKKVVNTTPSA